MTNRLKVMYRDGYALIRPLTFREVLEFTKIQSHMRDISKEDPEMYEVVAFYRDLIHVYRKGKRVVLERVSLDSFKELCIKVLTISMPSHSISYSFKCRDSQKKNFEKIALLDELNAYKNREEEKDDKRIAEMEKAIEEEPELLPCQATVSHEVKYEDLHEEKDSLFPKQLKKEGHRLSEVSVKTKVLLETITRHVILGDSIVLMENLPEDAKIEKLSPYIVEGELDFERVVEKGVSILFDLLYISGHFRKSSKNLESLLEKYDELLDADFDNLKKIDNHIGENLKPLEEKVLLTKCKSCNKPYHLRVSLEDFTFTPN